jgi:hypothetical protein
VTGSTLLWFLIPAYGIVGITTAVGLAYTIQNLLSVVQAYSLTKVWPYDRSVVDVMLRGLLTTLLALAVYLALGSAGVPQLARRIATFAAFAAGHGFSCLAMYRRSAAGVYAGMRAHSSS